MFLIQCTFVLCLCLCSEIFSCFAQYTVDENPFTVGEDTEEETEEIIDTRGVSKACLCSTD